MWTDHLTGVPSAGEAEVLAKILSCYGPPRHGDIDAWRTQLDAMFTGLANFAQRGIALTEELLGVLGRKDWERAKTLVGILAGLDEEMRVYGEIHYATKPLVIIARYERENLEGADALRLAQTTLRIYQECAVRCGAMMEKSTQFAAACRPVDRA